MEGNKMIQLDLNHAFLKEDVKRLSRSSSRN